MRFLVSVCVLVLAACQTPEPIHGWAINNCTVNIEPGGGLGSAETAPSFSVKVGTSLNSATITPEYAIKVGGVRVEGPAKLAVTWSKSIEVSIDGCPVCFRQRTVRLPRNLPTLFFQGDPSGSIYMSLHNGRTVIEIPIVPVSTAKRAG